MKTHHWFHVALVLVAAAVFGRAKGSEFPPFSPMESEWSLGADGRALTYIGTTSPVIRLPFSLEGEVRMRGLAVTVTTDATGLTMVSGRERIRIVWEKPGVPTRLSFTTFGAAAGVRVGDVDLPAARAGWIRIVEGMEAEAMIEFDRATYAIVEVPRDEDVEDAVEENGESGVEETRPDDEGDEERVVDAREDLAQTQRFVEGVPYLDLVRDVPASAVYQSAGRLKAAFRCGDCVGTGLFAQRRSVGRAREAGPFVVRDRETVMVRCEPCAGSGYKTIPSTRRVMDTFVERFSMVEPDGERYERGIEGQWAEKIREVLQIHPGSLGTLNVVWHERRRDLQMLKIGTPLWLVGRIDFDRPVWLRDREDQQTRAILVEYGGQPIIALVTNPQIEAGVPGQDSCLVGGIYAGVARIDESPMIPVIQGGFIVGR